MERCEIGWVTRRCPLGLLLVAGSLRGVCAVMLGEVRHTLLDELRMEFPWAERVPGGERLEIWAAAVAELAAGRVPDADVPLDVRGSRFQRRVWDALQGIPRGRTRTYGQLAAELGMPQGARAVARACATNPVALVVPCHRVVGADGKMRGYRWGTQRKQQLLEREKESELSLLFSRLSSANGPARPRSAA